MRHQPTDLRHLSVGRPDPLVAGRVPSERFADSGTKRRLQMGTHPSLDDSRFLREPATAARVLAPLRDLEGGRMRV
jgi:hypothetical protein